METDTTTTAGAATTALQEELMRLEDGAMERWRQGDPMGWDEVAAPEVTYVDSALTQPIVGQEAYKRYLEALIGKISYSASHYMRPRAVVHGNVAILTFNYQGSTNQADGTVQMFAPWNTTEVYARLEGQWRIIHTHWSFIRHTAPDRIEVPVPVVQAPSDRTGVLAELIALEAIVLQGLRGGSGSALGDICAPTVTAFDERSPQRLDGLSALSDHMAQVSANGDDHTSAFAFLEPRVQLHDDTAVLFYRLLSSTVRPDGELTGHKAWNCTKVYARIDDGWRLVHTHTARIGGQPPADFVSEAN